MKFIKNSMFCLVALIYLSSCHKGSGTVEIHLTDAPGDYKEVNVEIVEVKVKMEKGSGWTSLNTQQGIYNLLHLQNIDTLLAAGIVPAGAVQEVRLVLGSNNSVMLNDSSIHALAAPSAESSGLKIKVDKKVSDDDIATLLVDFDAKLSIHESGNGKYILNPVLKVK
jgi:hypothetical protein